MKYLVILLLLVTEISRAQIREDFSDGELEHDPAWAGDLLKFKTSNSSAVPLSMRPALQLDSEGEGHASLSLVQGEFSSLQWEFWLKMSFNTSSSNYSRIYLQADSGDPETVTSACFIQAGGTNDSVWLGRMDTAGEVLLYTLPSLYTGSSTNAIRLRVVRDGSMTWTFYGDPAGGNTLLELGSVFDASVAPGNHFILYCRHSASNASKFYFDDIYCGPEIIDSTGPVVNNAAVYSSTEILLSFNEPVEESSASNTHNYQLSGMNGHPYDAFRLLDPAQVMLFFEQAFQEGETYMLEVTNIYDLYGNIMDPASFNISYYIPKPYDIIINEIMADPAPAVLLPEYEYIELFNRTENSIDLTGWDLLVSGGSHLFPESAIGPRGYLLLMAEEALPAFKFCGPATGFSSFAITNSGAHITLQDTAGNIICHTYYDPEKYGDASGSEGGWALERTDPWYPCNDENSWRGSQDPNGGTPGRENSVKIDSQIPLFIEKICCENDSSVLVRFNQSMDPLSLSDPSLFSVNHGLGNPITAMPVEEDQRSALLLFRNKISPGILYRLEVSPDFKDCLGWLSGTAPGREFALPAECGPFDVIFNEIMFHPLNDGAEYIEVYNRTGISYRLEDLVLAYVREVPPNPPDTEYYKLSESCMPLMPGEYKVLSRYPDRVMAQFVEAPSLSFLKMDPFPSLNNEEGRLLLLDGKANTIDGLDYSEEMHFPLLNSFTGVALERIYPDVPGTGPGNWHSASSGSGFGTPGWRNSQYMEAIPHENVLEISPVVFSPDGDGKDDVLSISCKFEEAGMLVSIWVFGEDGKMVRRLVNVALAGTEDTYTWDGLTDDHYIAPDGIYVILLECVSMNGYSKKYKKVAALVSG